MPAHAGCAGFESLHVRSQGSTPTPRKAGRRGGEVAATGVQLFGARAFDGLSNQKLYAVYYMLQANGRSSPNAEVGSRVVQLSYGGSGTFKR